jgi:ferric-dicitrate binding protein FerR (iron transport regulator)
VSDKEQSHAEAAVSTDETLERAVAALPRQRMPERDLWPELEARLPRRQPRRARIAWATAAALMALYAGIWLRPELPADIAVPPGVASSYEATAETHLLNIFEAQKANQLAALHFQNPAVSRQLAVWNGAVQQVRGALAYYPDEPRLLLQLDSLYRQQLDYLEGLAMLDPQVAEFY